jgi:hypothetical protein
MMVQDLIVAAKGGNVSSLIQFAHHGIVDVAKDVWLESRESGIETNDSDDVGDPFLFALGAAIDADQVGPAEEEPAERHHGRLYGLLSRWRAWGRGSRHPQSADSCGLLGPASTTSRPGATIVVDA